MSETPHPSRECHALRRRISRREEMRMSPRVQLVVHPSSDPDFLRHAEIGLTIHVPAEYPVDDVVRAVLDHLRAEYPDAAIEVTESGSPEFDSTWTVYRDGLPSISDIG